MKSVLVTGAAGNIGSALVNSLIKSNKYYVVGIDNLSTGSISKIPLSEKNFTFIKLDVNDYREISSVFHSFSFDYVFHFAAVVGVKRTLENPLLVLKDIDGIRNILSLSKNCGINRVFYSSSSEVYGEPVSLPQNEEVTPLNSRLPYAIVKNLGEAYFKSYFKEHNLSFTIFRFFNTYGPNQSNDFVIPKFIKAALRNEPITIYGSGSQTRTFCYVEDNINAIISCLENNYYLNDIINIGSDIEYSILNLAEIIIDLTKSKSKIDFLPALSEGDMSRRKPDISKMKKIVGNFISLEEGIKNLIKFYSK